MATSEVRLRAREMSLWTSEAFPRSPGSHGSPLAADRGDACHAGEVNCDKSVMAARSNRRHPEGQTEVGMFETMQTIRNPR